MKEIYVRVLKKSFLLMFFFSLPTFAQDFSKVDEIVSNYPKSFSKVEDLALQKRVHYEIIHSFKNRSFNLLIRNIGLKIEISLRKNFKKY